MNLDPKLLPRTNDRFRGGYGARAIALSSDQKVLFVGCKDGSITIVDLERAVRGGEVVERRLRVTPYGEKAKPGVRAIYDLGKGWLLVGDDLRSLTLVPWDPSIGTEEHKVQTFEAGTPEEFSPITLIEEWDSSESSLDVVVSLRQGGTIVYRLERREGPNGPPFAFMELRRFEKARAICGILRDKAARLLISESGTLWVIDEHDTATETSKVNEVDPWSRFEKPGLISDVAPMSFMPNSAGGTGAYLSTDDGVFRLYFQWKGGSPNVYTLEINKELLPGFTGMSMAVSQAVWEDWRFLWVSDLIGDVSLFYRSRAQGVDQQPPWRRLGFRLESSQVVRSIATCLRIEGRDVPLIGQACRSDRIVVTWYAKTFLPWETEGSPLFDRAYLLSRGTWVDLERRVQIGADSSRRDWTPEAVLADFFEEAGEHADELAYFLANPSIDLAWSVLNKIACEDPEGCERRVGEAVLMWTYALIGTIHRRMRSRREQQCLGVIRWLRRLSEQSLKGEERWQGEVAEAIERAIQHVRKWGVFGSTYYERQEIGAPLQALRDGQSDYRKFDHIVYSSLLFSRRINQEAEFPESPRGPLTPWDVQYLAFTSQEGGQRHFAAVSWRAGTELYEQHLSAHGLPSTWRQLWPASQADMATVGLPTQESRTVEGYSRKVLMGIARRRNGNYPYILEAPVKLNERESLKLWWIDPALGGKVEAEPKVSDLEEGESVYSLLELSPGLVLAGLQGGKDDKKEEGLPLVVVRITPGGEVLRLMRGYVLGDPFPSVYPKAQTSPRNPILALALDPNDKRENNRYTVIVGREDGQILRITLNILEHNFQITRWSKVGRMSSPVRTLAYQASRSDSSGSLSPRVFAGAADGTIIAFQELRSSTIRSENAREETTFCSLWATREEGPIARLHLCERVLLPEDEEVGLVLAVTQKGMAILFLNSYSVELKKDWNLHQRIKVPGERLGRFSLQANVFGSALVQEKHGVNQDQQDQQDQQDYAGETEAIQNGFGREGRVARLVVATGEGTLRLLTLHYPKYTESRKKVFQDIQNAWLWTLRDSQGRLKTSLLRKVESMHAAAPHLPAVFVRWLLSPEPTKESWAQRERIIDENSARGPACQWIPRHLQALVRLDEEWSAERTLKNRLWATLIDAWKVEDIPLFKEILEVTLRRANKELFQQARGDGDWDFASQFRELMQDIDEMKGVWLGESSALDTKIRIIFAKNLVDGDTLWSLASTLDKPGNPLQDAMETRVGQLHRFLTAGDPLLALETLRAANLAIFRACRRLSDARSETKELHWKSIRGYFQAVGDFAARVAHSGPADMSEAVAHEICRAYAVGVLACPSHAFRLSSLMCEADLPQEFWMKVQLQLELLEQLLGRSLSQKPRELFEAVALKLQRLEIDPGTLLTSVQSAWGESADVRDLGADNKAMLLEWGPFDNLIAWLRGLAEQLSIEASNVSFLEAWDHHKALTSPVGEEKQAVHSREFWTKALESLIKRLENMGLRRNSELWPRESSEGRLLPVRPDLVLFSESLKKWCIEQLKDLRRRKDQYVIFDPQYSMYTRTLESLAAAAAGFPRGAALQKNVVLGVLGHSLLELLDEHILELWEIAQLLDPMQTWDQEDRGRAQGQQKLCSKAAEFADYLLSAATQAEMIPKNLRNLQGLLSYPVQESKALETSNLRSYTLNQLFQEFREFGWRGAAAVPHLALSARSYHFLRLTLGELAHNHEVHGSNSEMPAVHILASAPPKIGIKFPYKREDFHRLVEVIRDSGNLQRPVRPLHSRSHGAGLYLASLSAAAEGWKLAIEEDLAKSSGYLHFILHKVEAR